MTEPKRFLHRDGRRCIWSEFAKKWIHIDHPDPEPGPRQPVDYHCSRYHNDPADGEIMTMEAHEGDRFTHTTGRVCKFGGEGWTSMKGTLTCRRDHPRDSEQYDCQHDRGEFGMPTIGADVLDVVREMQAYHYPDKFYIIPSNVPVGPKVERVCNIMDEAQTLYKTKAAGYRGVEGDTADHLGAKGQFADINRKFWRLKAMLWDEVVPMYPDAGAGESVEEILMDFIGHAALTIDFLRESRGHGEDNGA